MKKNAFLLAIMLCSTIIVTGQNPLANSEFPKPTIFTTQQDHANMQEQLGIKKLRPGKSGNESDPNAANYDEAKANPCPQLPDALTLNNGKKITTADQWWKQRRPEIVDAFETEVYGKIPANTPKVTWTAKITDYEFVGRIPVIARQMVGKVDNSAYPLIEVNINMVLVLPTNVKGPVPVLIMFGFPSLPAPAQPNPADMEKINQAFREMMSKDNPEMKAIFEKYPAYNPITRLAGPNFFAPPPPGGPSPTEQLLAGGWGYCVLEPNSIQADNGAGLTKGIIGLVNKGQPRKPDDWGALRAWGWGASRALDFFETDTLIDAKRVGIEGVSRYGKAALVTMAFDQRFAVGLIGSSGKGGVTLHRRVFGESVENLTGGGGYHWMAGNYLKYGAEEATFGRKTGCDLPVDSHELLALAAPRPTFISYGIPEKGDANWLDQRGSYQATVAAGTVFKLLGAKDLGVTNDYLSEKMPPMLTDMLNGHLAWRQHDGGHTDAPNFIHFIPWANGFLGYKKVSR